MKNLLLYSLTFFTLYTSAQELDATWTKTIGNEGDTEIIYAMDVDPFGNLISTGVYIGAMDFDPNETEHVLAGDSLRNLFIQKLNHNGNLIWAKTIGGGQQISGNSITTDAAGNIYIGGGFRKTVDFDPSEGEEIRTAEAYTDAFLLKLDANGNFEWVHTMGSEINDLFTKIKIGNDGNLYTTGEFTGTIDFNPGPGETLISAVDMTDLFVAKYNPSGDLFWAYSFGGDHSEYASGLALDSDDNIIISGNYRFEMDVDPSDAEYILEPVGYNTNFILKWTADGEFIWVKAFGTHDYFDFNNGLIVDSNDDLYAFGRYYGTIDFNPGPAVFNMTAIGLENNNYILKLNSDGDFVLARSIGNTTATVGIQEMAIDDEDGIYCTGNFETTVDFNPNPGSYTLTSAGFHDYFIMKLDTDLNFEWAKSAGAENFDVGYEVATSESFAYVSGVYSETVDFNLNEGVREFTSNGEKDIFIQKIVPAFAGISDFEETDLFSVYPNPTRTDVIIDLNENDSYTLTLTDIAGKIIFKTQVSDVPTHQFEINREPGVFLLTIDNGATVITKKIIKY